MHWSEAIGGWLDSMVERRIMASYVQQPLLLMSVYMYAM